MLLSELWLVDNQYSVYTIPNTRQPSLCFRYVARVFCADLQNVEFRICLRWLWSFNPLSCFIFRFLALPHPGRVIYKSCIELESNLASAGDRDSLVEARKLYESALATYNQDVSLWQSYYSLEIKVLFSPLHLFCFHLLFVFPVLKLQKQY